MNQDEECSTKENNNRRLSRTPSSQIILPNTCIFCKKSSKYKKGTKTREPLSSCSTFCADESIRCIAIEKGDSEILKLVTNDLIAREAKYHKRCYQDYTRPIKKPVEGQEDLVYDILVDITNELFLKDVFVTFENFKMVYKEKLSQNGFELSIKNLRRTIERRLPQIIFLEFQQKVILYLKTLTVEEVLFQYIGVKAKLEEMTNISSTEIAIKNCAETIRNDLKSSNFKMKWPPLKTELDMNNFVVPNKLSLFLKTILKTENKERLSRQISSFSQDLFYAVHHGNIMTPKSVLLPLTIKHLTNNTELVTIIARLGHGISYTKLMEVITETGYATLEKNSQYGVCLPEECEPMKFTMIVEDNIDRSEHTLTGFGTTHKVNSILIQPGVFNESLTAIDTSNGEEPSLSKKRRSLKTNKPPLKEYIYNKRCSLDKVFSDKRSIEFSDIIHADHHINNLVWVLTRRSPSATMIPSWTGYHIKLRKNSNISTSSVHYLDCLDAPATDMSTIYHLLERSLKIREILNLQSIVCVYDQAIYSKATEIKLKEPEKFKSLFLMMGTFHIILMFLGVIGTRFGDAGLKDLLVQSEVVAGGSVESVLKGKHYNRAVRSYKLLWESLWTLILDKYESNSGYESPYLTQCTEENLDTLTASSSFQEYLNGLYTFKTNLCNNSSLFKFWMTFSDMIETLLLVLFSTRTGNWSLYTESLRCILPWTFAYDRQNYARYLTYHFLDIMNLEENYPEIYEEFMAGNFSVQISKNNPFGKLEADKVIETTINRDTKTGGGTTGFSTNQDAVYRWTLTSSFRAYVYSKLQEYLNSKTAATIHQDLQPSRIKKDLVDVSSILQLFQETFVNPTEEELLISLSSGIAANESIMHDLLNAYSFGEEKLNDFINDRLTSLQKSLFEPVKKLKLQTFANLKKKLSLKVKGRDVHFESQSALFGKISLISQNRSINLREIFQYPLGPLPFALADSMGLTLKNKKSDLLKYLEKDIIPVSKVPSQCCSIIDGMAFIRKIKCSGITFLQFSELLLANILQTCGDSPRIDIVFDSYFKDSIKGIERSRRGTGDTIRMKRIIGSNVIRQWGNFICVNENKNELIKFLVSQWKFKALDQTIYATCENKCICLNDGREIAELVCAQEEADTRMFLHAKHASVNFNNIVIHTPDTDVFILALVFHDKLENTNIYIRTGVKYQVRVISIERVLKNLEGNSDNNGRQIIAEAILGLHAFTGCDTVSGFWRKGKIRPLKILLKNSEYIKAFSKVGVNWNICPAVSKILETFVCVLYGSKSCADVNILRYQMYCENDGRIDAKCLPPCENSLRYHILRSNYQAVIWRKAFEADPLVPDPAGFGWKKGENGLEILWNSCNAAPEEVIDLLCCHCSKECRKEFCACYQNNLECTEACHKFRCTNFSTEDCDIDDDYCSSDGISDNED